MPPWMTLNEFADDPLQKSARSTSATDKPLSVASQAAHAPKTPPPTTTRSNDRSASARKSRFIGSHQPLRSHQALLTVPARRFARASSERHRGLESKNRAELGVGEREVLAEKVETPRVQRRLNPDRTQRPLE